MTPYDSWRLASPPEAREPEPAFDLGGDILDRELRDDGWAYLVADANGGAAEWLSEADTLRVPHA